MEEEGGTPTQQRLQSARGQGREGATLNRKQSNLVRSQGEEEGGGTPRTAVCAPRARHAGEGGTPTPRQKRGGTPLN